MSLLDRRGAAFTQTVRELAGGRRTTMTLRVNGFLAVQMLAYRNLRHPRIEVLVTDRAGNVARRRGTVALRIVDRPLIEFQVAPNHDFAMFSKAGDRAVGQMVNELIAGLADHSIRTQRDMRRRYLAGFRAIHKRHFEIEESEVGDEIFTALLVPAVRRGFDLEAVMSS